MPRQGKKKLLPLPGWEPAKAKTSRDAKRACHQPEAERSKHFISNLSVYRKALVNHVTLSPKETQKSSTISPSVTVHC